MTETRICCRCLKQVDGVHTCTPSEGWGQMEEKIAQLISELDDAKRTAGFNMVQYQDLGLVLHQECEKSEKLLEYLVAIRDLSSKYPKDPVKASVEAHKLSKLAILGWEYKKGG